MNVLLISSSSGSRGGGEHFLLYLGEALAQRGHNLTLWVSSHPRMDELAADFSPIGAVVRSDYPNTYDRAGRSLTAAWDARLARRVVREWRALKPDILHLNKQNLEDALDLLRALSLAETPAVCTIHLTQNARFLGAKSAWLRDAVARRALRRARFPFVTVLDERRRDLEAFLKSNERLHVIPNGVPILDIASRELLRASRRRDLDLAEDALLVIGVGRMVEQKRPLYFLETAQRLLAWQPNARVVWIGDGPLAPEWDEWVSAHQLGGAMQRLSWQADVQPLLAAADLFLHVADFEGLPLALLEALAAGLPCAISENLLREMPFLNQENSVAISNSDAWLHTVLDRGSRKKISTAARALAAREFSCATMASRYEALYQKTADDFAENSHG